MNAATKRFTGPWKRFCGVSTCCSRPSRITATRCPSVIASTWSCVTYTVVTPAARAASRAPSASTHAASRRGCYRGEWELTVTASGAKAVASRPARRPRRNARHLARPAARWRRALRHLAAPQLAGLGTGRARGRVQQRCARTRREASSGRAVKPGPDSVLESDSVRAWSISPRASCASSHSRAATCSSRTAAPTLAGAD